VKGLPESNRVLRGGSFNNNRQNVRSANRNRNNPNNRNDNNGFRVCLAHIFTCLPEMPRGASCWPRLLEMARAKSWLFAKRAEYTKSPAVWEFSPRGGALLFSVLSSLN
jgi:hypothetical protein